MAEHNMDSIPQEKNAPPRLSWNLSEPLLYDFNDPDSQFVMFNRELEGCVIWTFWAAAAQAFLPLPLP